MMKMHLEIVLLHSTLKRDFLQVKNDLLKYVIYLVHKPLKSGGGGGSSSTAEMPIRGCQIGGPLLRPKRGHCGIFFLLASRPRQRSMAQITFVFFIAGHLAG